MTFNQSRPYALMGLPVHAVSQAETVNHLWQAVRSHQQLFLTTPNLNFAVACRSAPAFRLSVLQSDLVVADGMPLVWVARLLGIPIKERVAGSSVFESIRTSPPPDNGPRMRVFFFGGQAGVARLAHERLNAGSPGMESVGFLDPGFGSVEQMSADAIIEAINAADPDFLVVALGAAKGQAWIQRNRSRLNARVISHLGAVINFSAGSLQRSPVLMQKLGLEWLWRIKEEPLLWRRYLGDGLAFLALMLQEVLPLWVYTAWRRIPEAAFLRAGVKVQRNRAFTRLTFDGCWGRHNRKKLDATLAPLVDAAGSVFIDLGKVQFLDAAAVGSLLSFMGKRSARALHCECQAASPALRRLLGWHGASQLAQA